MGSSAGGYLSLLSGTFAVKPHAVVSFFGDILCDWYTQPIYSHCQYPPIAMDVAERSVGGKEKSAGRPRRYTFYLYCRQPGIWPQAVSSWYPVADRATLLRYCLLITRSRIIPPRSYYTATRAPIYPSNSRCRWRLCWKDRISNIDWSLSSVASMSSIGTQHPRYARFSRV